MKRPLFIVVVLLALTEPARAAISLVAIGAEATSTATTPMTVACSAAGLLPIKKNDLLLAQISVYDPSATAVTFTVTPPANWAVWPGYPNTNFVSGSRTDGDFLYYAYGGPPLGLSFTVADSGANAGNYNCRIWQFRGTRLGTPNDGNASKATAQNAVTSVTTVSVTASAGDELLVFCANSDHTISSFAGSPALTLGYSDNTNIAVRSGYLVPSAGATTAYACNAASSTTMEGEQVLIAVLPPPNAAVLFNSCASTGCSGTPIAGTWAFDPLANTMKLESDGAWAAMP